jgi:hypothetical protein
VQRALDDADTLALDAGRRRQRLLGEEMAGAVVDEAEHDEALRLKLFALKLLAERPGQDALQHGRDPGRGKADRVAARSGTQDDSAEIVNSEAWTEPRRRPSATSFSPPSAALGDDAQVEAAGRAARPASR